MSLYEELKVWGIVPKDFFSYSPWSTICHHKWQRRNKYVDDTLFTIANDTNGSKWQQAVNDLVNGSQMNGMQINATKTKEMEISFGNVATDIAGIVVNGTTLAGVIMLCLL